MSKMRVLVAFDFNDTEAGSPDDERAVEAMQRIGDKLRQDGIVDGAHVYDVLFFNLETDTWE
jgi:hypothetical protein